VSAVALSRRWPVRATRAFMILALAYNLAWGIFDLSRGRVFGPICLACAGAITATLAWQVRYLHRAEIARLAQPRPDYAAIASMEREVYGETFRHEGAPARTVSRPAVRWDGRTTHPDTTQPATIEDYVLWLQGYVKRGGKPTHFYDYPFSQMDFRYASSRLVVDSDYEYGSSLRHIIVARNVTTERTNPAGPFNGWAHTKCYFMHGYRTNDSIVPVYSDPEFDEFRSSASR
jgi:hypothetical protein